MSDWIVARRAALSEAELDGELLGLHVEQGTCYGFNGTATRVWKMIAQPTRLSALRDALLLQYDVDAETCERDLRGLLRTLEQDGLVSIDDSPP
ncbi:PqqD family protein [Sphingosinicella sp. YJ22]|uniref:PqqD family protein n=1 Tax=Sphingosinicella sp. YJ22 TaxID=1104780 RepID=UPI00140B01E3|nr:PqqD family protein [Sphingosinicella sp. YJ22]